MLFLGLGNEHKGDRMNQRRHQVLSSEAIKGGAYSFVVVWENRWQCGLTFQSLEAPKEMTDLLTF